jgi:hypothetical protein
MAGQIMQAAQQNPQAADQMAMELGYAVVQMIAQQEQVNPTPQEQMPQEGLPPEAMMGGAGETAMMPQEAMGGGQPYMEEPI